MVADISGSAKESPLPPWQRESHDYASLIERHWRRYLPHRHAGLRDPKAFYAHRGEQFHQEVIDRAASLALAYCAQHSVPATLTECVWSSAVFSAEAESIARLWADRHDRRYRRRR